MSEIARTQSGYYGADEFPVKIYTFMSYVKTFGCGRSEYKLAHKMLREHPEIAEGHEFALMLAYAFKEPELVEGIDVFSARRKEGTPWEGSAMMYDSWTFENGVYVPREKGTTCGTGGIILGREEEFRRTTSHMPHFMGRCIDVSDL